MDLSEKKESQLTCVRDTQVTWYPEGYLEIQARKKAAKQTAKNKEKVKRK